MTNVGMHRRSRRLWLGLVVAVAAAVGVLGVVILPSSSIPVEAASEPSAVDLESLPVRTGRAVVPSVESEVRGSNNGHITIDEPGCSGRTVNNEYTEPNPRVRFGDAQLLTNGDLGGPIAVFSFAHPDDSVFPSSGLVSQPLAFSDGSGVVTWLRDSSPFALLSVKRMDEALLLRVADAVQAHDPGSAGFNEVDLGSVGADVELSSCMTDGGFIAVETVTGEQSARLAHLLDADPTRVIELDDGLYLEYDRRSAPGPIVTRDVNEVEWRELVAATRANDGADPGQG